MRQAFMKWLLVMLVVALIPLGYRSYRAWKAHQSAAEVDAIATELGCSPSSEGMTKLKALLDKDPECVAARLALGDCYEATGDVNGAEEQYKLALKSSPKDPRAAFKLGEFYYIRKRHRKAINALEQCIQEDSRYPAAKELLARCYERLHDSKNALKTWQRVLAEHPRNDIARRAIERVQRGAQR